MIIFVFTRAKARTHAQLPEWPEMQSRMQVWSYSKLFRHARLPAATYIFGDFDRLEAWDLELAALVFRALEAAGARALNDPGRVLQRYALLRRLKAEGQNDFNVWLLEADGMPDRFPVFLRTASLHRGAMSELLDGPDAVRAAADALLGQGVPSRELLAVEFAAQSSRGVFHKLSAHKVGGQIVTSLSVNDAHWMAKIGTKGAAGAEHYADEREAVAQNRFADALRPAFDLARIDYGRVDFGIYRDRLQIYEINTNPRIRRVFSHPNADRLASDGIWRARFCEALTAIDSGPGRPIALDHPVLANQRRQDRWTFGERFTR